MATATHGVRRLVLELQDRGQHYTQNKSDAVKAALLNASEYGIEESEFDADELDDFRLGLTNKVWYGSNTRGIVDC